MQDGPTPNFLSPALIDRLIEGNRGNQAEAQFTDGLLQTGVITVSLMQIFNVTVFTVFCL